jgi:hypothetical protein
MPPRPLPRFQNLPLAALLGTASILVAGLRAGKNKVFQRLLAMLFL